MNSARSQYRKFAAAAFKSHFGNDRFLVNLGTAGDCEGVLNEFVYMGCAAERADASHLVYVSVPPVYLEDVDRESDAYVL